MPERSGDATLGAGSRFVVLCPARSGSTLLMTLLWSHPACAIFGEIFGPPTPAHVEALGEPVMALRQSDPPTFFAALYAPQEGKSAIGFKFKFKQLFRTAIKPARDVLAEDPDLRVVLLTRRDLLRRFLSIAQVRQNYKQYNFSYGEEPPPPLPLRLDVEACLDDCEQVIRREQRLRTIFARQPRLELTYEDLLADPDAATGRVQDFIGLPRHSLRSGLKRLTVGALEDLVINLPEIVEGARSRNLAHRMAIT